MTEKLRDIEFSGFRWKSSGRGDLDTTEGLQSLRALIHRWLVTEPAVIAGINAEETELRRIHESGGARESSYNRPAGKRAGACLPWNPSWGAGIKSRMNRPVTPQWISEMRTIIRNGLARLQGVSAVRSVEVSAIGPQVTVTWSLTSEFGDLSDRTVIV